MRIISPILAGLLGLASNSSYAQNEIEVITGLSVIVNFASATSASASCSSSKHDFSHAEQINIARLVAERNFTNNGQAGSLRDYFWDNSRGSFDLNNTVIVVDLPTSRSDYECAGLDQLDQNVVDTYDFEGENHKREHVADLTGGPLFNLINDVNCRIFGGCSIAVDYQIFDPTSRTYSHRAVPLDSSTLSTGLARFDYDQLDKDIHLGNIDLGGRGRFIEHLRFFQIITPGESSTPSQGLWPRSIPSLDTDRTGLNNIALGRVQINPIQLPDGSTFSTGVMAHETGHTLFDLRDLYDTQGGLHVHDGFRNGPINPRELDLSDPVLSPNVDNSQWYDSYGVGKHSLMGSISVVDRNPPLLNAQNRELAGWEDPLDISDAAEGEEFIVDWLADGSQANIAPSFKYCRRDSSLDECFYIEARINGGRKNPILDGVLRRTINTPSNQSGLLIWHTSDYNNPADFEINKRKENSDNLHFSVELIEADGNSDLLSNRDLPTSPPLDAMFHRNDYFSNNENFNGVTNPSSNWWDGSASGFSLTNIRVDGNTVRFEIGRRPVGIINLDYDSSKISILENGVKKTKSIRSSIGSSVNIVLESNSGENMLYMESSNAIESDIFTGLFHVDPITVASGSEVSIPITNSDKIFNVITENSRELERALFSRYHIPRNTIMKNTFFDPEDSEFLIQAISGTRSGRTSFPFNGSTETVNNFHLEVQDGYRVAKWKVENQATGSSASGTDNMISYSPALSPTRITVESEPLPGKLCAEGVVSNWKWDAVYRGVGTKVRFNNVIYASNLQRNYIFENGSLYDSDRVNFNPTTPENTPEHWTPVEICGEYVGKCSDHPKWEDEPEADRVVYGNKLWTKANSEEFGSNHIPGDFPLLANRFVRSGLGPDSNLDYIRNSTSLSDGKNFAKWILEANCNDTANVSRAFIEKTDGITNLRSQNFTSLKDGHWSPILSWWWSKSLYLYFDVEPGFVLDDVYVNGVPQNVSQSARSHRVYYPSLPRQAHYVEVRARPI